MKYGLTYVVPDSPDRGEGAVPDHPLRAGVDSPLPEVQEVLPALVSPNLPTCRVSPQGVGTHLVRLPLSSLALRPDGQPEGGER